MNKKILVVGSLNMDITITVDEMPKEGETICGKSISYIPGGKGANQACAVGNLNGNVKMLGIVGKDSFGDSLREELKKHQVDVSDIRVETDDCTGTAVIYVNQKGNNSIVVLPCANKKCTIEYLIEMDNYIEASDYLLVQMEIPSESVQYVVHRAKTLGKTIILNPAPAPDSIPNELLSMIDYITPNETELLKLTSGGLGTEFKEMKRCARQLLKRGVKNVIVTLGNRGALWMSKTKECVLPSREVSAIDSTAAGDCFNGAFVVGLAEGMSVEESINFANVAASICVTRKGAQPSLPNRDEVNKLI